MARIAWMGMLATLLSACAGAAGPPAPAPASVDGHAAAASVVLCRTTEAELRRALGEPTRDGRLRDARVLSWIISEDAVVSFIAVLLDARGVVVDLYWDLPSEVAWAPADQCAGRR